MAAVVLAAGSSTRMGAANKLLLDVDGAPMIERVVEAALASRAAPVVVVTGHEAPRVRTALGGRPIVWAHNEGFAAGMSTSIRRGIEALPGDVDGALFLLGDMPRVASRHIDTLVEVFCGTEAEPRPSVDERRARICAPVHRGRRGNPVLWGARYLPELRALTGDRGARDLLDRYARAVQTVETDDAVTIDVDTPDAASNVVARFPPFHPDDGGDPTSQ